MLSVSEVIFLATISSLCIAFPESNKIEIDINSDVAKKIMVAAKDNLPKVKNLRPLHAYKFNSDSTIYEVMADANSPELVHYRIVAKIVQNAVKEIIIYKT